MNSTTNVIESEFEISMVFDILMRGGRSSANARTALEIDHKAVSLVEWRCVDRLVEDLVIG